MDGMTIARAAQICGAQLIGCENGEAELGELVIDSRAVQPGDLFAAFRGERVDGHDYISKALEKGASCCLAERVPEGVTGPLLITHDVQSAIEALAKAYRESLTLPVIGVTGSVGKTSTKEMLYAVLSQRYKVLKTEGNLNNQLGVPMTVSRIRGSHEAAIVEMGISGFGEMRQLAKMARPTIAVYTLIGHAHLEFLHDLDGVMRAKGEMLEEMPKTAPVIINGDDEKLCALVCRQRKISCGFSDGCMIRADKLRNLPDGGTAFVIEGEGRRFPVELHSFGRHLVYAALEACAVALELGLSEEEIAAGITAYRPLGRRSAVWNTEKYTLIDDCYNSNPDSARSGLRSLCTLPGRHVAILGDMLEMGGEAPEMHAALGRFAVEQGCELLLCVGELSRQTAIAAGPRGKHFSSNAELIRALPSLLEEGDQILVKASRGMHLEEISEAVKSLGGEART